MLEFLYDFFSAKDILFIFVLAGACVLAQMLGQNIGYNKGYSECYYRMDGIFNNLMVQGFKNHVMVIMDSQSTIIGMCVIEKYQELIHFMDENIEYRSSPDYNFYVIPGSFVKYEHRVFRLNIEKLTFDLNVLPFLYDAPTLKAFMEEETISDEEFEDFMKQLHIVVESAARGYRKSNIQSNINTTE